MLSSECRLEYLYYLYVVWVVGTVEINQLRLDNRLKLEFQVFEAFAKIVF